MVDPSADRAIFRQIADDLRARIVSGEYPPGSSLPVEATLVYTYDAGRLTVRAALDELEAEGRITRRRGRAALVREQQALILVKIPRGGRVRSRMPTDEERREHRMEAGVPLLIRFDPAGRELEPLPADRYELGFS